MCLKASLNQASSRLYSTATLSLPSMGKNFTLFLLRPIQIFSQYTNTCSNFGVKRISIFYFDSDFFFIHRVQHPNEMLDTGLEFTSISNQVNLFSSRQHFYLNLAVSRVFLAV